MSGQSQRNPPTDPPRPDTRFIILGSLITALATGALIVGAHLPLLTAALVGTNGASLFLCGFDKSIARTNRIRVPERVLLLFALFGGTIGLLIGIVLFRHKTRTPSFILRFAVVVFVQLLLFRFCAIDTLFGFGDFTLEEMPALGARETLERHQ